MDDRGRPRENVAGSMIAVAILLAGSAAFGFGLGLLIYGIGWIAHGVRAVLS